MLIRHLRAIFDGSGFVTKDGRFPGDEDCGFRRGPIDIAIDDAGIITAIGSNLRPNGPEFDGRGFLAIPGYIDPHTHAIFDGERSGEYFMRWVEKSYVEIAKLGGGIHSTVRATNEADVNDLR